MIRLTAESWSALSRIWKPCGRRGELPVRAQEAVAQAVEGADPHAAHGQRQHRAEPGQHLLGRLVGEGHRHHAARRHLAGLDQPGDARRQHPRLAGAGAGQDQRRRGGSVTAASCSGLSPRSRPLSGAKSVRRSKSAGASAGTRCMRHCRPSAAMPGSGWRDARLSSGGNPSEPVGAASAAMQPADGRRSCLCGVQNCGIPTSRLAESRPRAVAASRRRGVAESPESRNRGIAESRNRG